MIVREGMDSLVEDVVGMGAPVPGLATSPAFGSGFVTMARVVPFGRLIGIVERRAFRSAEDPFVGTRDPLGVRLSMTYLAGLRTWASVAPCLRFELST